MSLVRWLVLAIYMATAGIYAYVGRRLQRADTGYASTEAWLLFGSWWILIGGSRAIHAGELSLVEAGVNSLAVFTGLLYVDLLVQTTAIACLLSYILYLRTGDDRVVPIVGWYYLAVFLGFIVAFGFSEPGTVTLPSWGVNVEFVPPLEGPALTGLVSLLVLPLLFGLAAYMEVFRHVSDRTSRYRILLVAGSLLLWVGTVYGAFLFEGTESAAWPVVLDGLGLVAALVVFVAYFPPSWLRERLGVRSLPEASRSGADTVATGVEPSG